MNSRKRSIAAALMVAMFLGAVEGTVVTTAIPTIVKDLQGFEIISSVFSVYLLTSAIATPIYGKLSDLYGRKNMLSIGIIIFLIGSFLCGLSQTMYMLIGARAVQGIGAGAIFTVTYTNYWRCIYIRGKTKDPRNNKFCLGNCKFSRSVFGRDFNRFIILALDIFYKSSIWNYISCTYSKKFG